MHVEGDKPQNFANASIWKIAVIGLLCVYESGCAACSFLYLLVGHRLKTESQLLRCVIVCGGCENSSKLNKFQL